MKWTTEQEDFLEYYYPDHGKLWCAMQLKRTEASVRWKTSMMGLKLNTEGEFFKDFQKRAAESKVGKKRPEHSKHMKKLCEEGRLPQMTEPFTEDRRVKMAIKTKKWIAKNGHPKGMKGKKHSEEVKKIIGQKAKDSAKRMTPEAKAKRRKKHSVSKKKNGNWFAHTKSPNLYSRGVSGKRDDLGGQFFRSKAEANYARYLNWENIKWEYEPKHFWFDGIKRGTVTYTPDFYLPELDVWIEFKGWLDPKSKTRLRRFKKYFPEEFKKMNIVKQKLTTKSYGELTKIGFSADQIKDFKAIESMKSLIPNWEK